MEGVLSGRPQLRRAPLQTQVLALLLTAHVRVDEGARQGYWDSCMKSWCKA